MTPRIGSLCSGYGGLEEGVRAVLGGEVAWHSEIDPGARKILAARYPGVPNLGDMTVVDWSAVEPVDVLCGGTPCQDLSHAGKRAGMTEGTRSNLWVAMREAIAVLRPPLVVWENVRGAYSACADSELGSCPGCVDGREPHRPLLRAVGRVLGDLSSLGFDASWQGLRAADVGAPHERFRVFVVAWPAAYADRLGLERGRRPRVGRSGPADDDLTAAYAHGGPVREQPVTLSGCSGTTVAGHAGPDAAADSDHAAHDRERSRPESRCGGQAPANTQGHGRHQGWPEPARVVGRLDAAVSGDAASSDTDDDGRTRLGRELAIERDSDRCRSTHTLWGDYEPAIRRWERLTRPAPPPREPGGKSGERLAPVFVEWMQGLPEGWVTDPAIWDGLTDKKGRVLTGRRLASARRDAQLKALGNGVVPQQAEHALRLLLPDARAAA